MKSARICLIAAFCLAAVCVVLTAWSAGAQEPPVAQLAWNGTHGTLPRSAAFSADGSTAASAAYRADLAGPRSENAPFFTGWNGSAGNEAWLR